MNKYAVINLKTDPKLKKLAAQTADRLGISLSAVLNNELRRFTIEQSVVFELLEVPNAASAKGLAESRVAIEGGDFYSFTSDEAAVEFLAEELE